MIKDERNKSLRDAATPRQRSGVPSRLVLLFLSLLNVIMMMTTTMSASAFVLPPPSSARLSKTSRRVVFTMVKESSSSVDAASPSSNPETLSSSSSKVRGQGQNSSNAGQRGVNTAAPRSNGNYNTRKNYKNQSNKYASKKSHKFGNNKFSGGGGALAKQKRLNRLFVQSETPDQLFQALQQAPGALTKQGGGGALNTVNFSTAMHRLARHSLQNKASRSTILADPRLALLMAAIAETLVATANDDDDDDDAPSFSSREYSNISWALAKLALVPPTGAMALQSSSDDNNEKTRTDKLVTTAKELRLEIVKASKAKRPGEALKPVWIPQLSQLAGLVMDDISTKVSSRQDLTDQEGSNLIYSWATADRADPVICNVLMRRLMTQDGEDRNQQTWANVVWGFATARIYEGYEELLDFVANLMQDEAFTQGFKPQEASNCIWGCATLLSNLEGEIPDRVAQSVLRIARSLVPLIVSKVDHFKPQELSNTIWGMATLGFGMVDSAELRASGYVVLPSESPELDENLKLEAVEAIVAAADEKLRMFKPQELNNMAYGLARLLEPGTTFVFPLMHKIGVELCNPRRRIGSQDIGSTIWAMATIGLFDGDLYRQLVSRFTPDLVASCTTELSNTIWALATAEIDIGVEKDAFDVTLLPNEKDRPYPRDPLTVFMGDVAMQLIQRPRDFKPQEIKDVLYSFSKLCVRHPELFKRTAEYLVGREEDDFASSRGLRDFNQQALGNTAWAFARQAQLAEQAADRNKAVCALTFKYGGRLAVKKAAASDVGEAVLEKLFHEIAETDLHVHNNLSDLKPQDVSNTAWTFGLLSICHDGFVEAAKKQLQQRIKRFLSGHENSMTRFKGQECANLIWGLATLNASPDGLLDDVGEYLKRITRDENGKVTIKGIASVFKRRELANIAWACAVFGEYPSDLMTYLYGGLLGNQKNPQSLTKIYGDDGLQSQAIMTLLYVQTAIELSGSKIGVKLPPNFPEGWTESSSSGGWEDDAPAFELNLSTSKIQRDVSDAFKRIGFDHEEEHVITMADLSSEYGIGIAPQPREVLSIDIANVQDRIAVEVDGPSHFFTTINDADVTVSRGGTYALGNQVEYQFLWNGDRQRINGPTALKERLLNSLGWKVIHLPFWEWHELENEKEQEDYCRKLLSNI